MNTKHNILSNLVFEKLKTAVFDFHTPWFLIEKSAYNNPKSTVIDSIRDYSWQHIIFNDGVPNSNLFDIADTAIRSALDNSNQTLSKIYRIRLGLITATTVPHVHGPHIDSHSEHMTGLIYLNSTDGDTIFYNEMYDPNSGLDGSDYYESVLNKTVTVKEQFTPQENTLVWFNGFQYHSSTTPTTVYKRIVLNFNYEN
jgi:hypothetical protein